MTNISHEQARVYVLRGRDELRAAEAHFNRQQIAILIDHGNQSITAQG